MHSKIASHLQLCVWLPIIMAQLHALLPLQAVLVQGIHAIAVVLKHAAVYPAHEKAVGELAKQLGFTQVGLGFSTGRARLEDKGQQHPYATSSRQYYAM